MNNVLNVFLTIDVEYTGMSYYEKNTSFKIPSSSLDCYVNGKSYGLPFIIEILDKNSLKGNFFVEPFSKFYFGEEQLKRNIDHIRKNKHDIQLHLHPSWLIFKDGKKRSDNLYDYNLNQQAKLIAFGKSILNKFRIKPIAFRACRFTANNDTYLALKKNKIPISSNYNLAFLNKDCFIRLDKKINDVNNISETYEFPITNYMIRDLRTFLRYTYKPLQIGCTSFKSMVKVLEYAHKNKMNSVTLILHNFEFLDRRDKHWIKKPLKINKKIVANFKNMGSYLKRNKDKYNVTTFSEFYKMIKRENLKFNNRFKIHKINSIYLPI